MDFRTRLREEIDFSGLLDKEVAARANISKRTIDSYVGSQNCMPSADVAVRLAKVLNTTVEYLVTGSNPEIPQTHDIKLQEQARAEKPKDELEALIDIDTGELS